MLPEVISKQYTVLTNHTLSPQVKPESHGTPTHSNELCRLSLEIFPDWAITAALTFHGFRVDLDFTKILADDALCGYIRTE